MLYKTWLGGKVITMKLIKSTENHLLLDFELEHTMFFRLRWYFIGSLPMWIVFEWLRRFTVDDGWGEYVLIGARVIAFIIVLLSFLLGYILLMTSLDNPVEKCTFEKSLNRITLFNKVMWRLWKEEVKQYPLNEVKSVKLQPSEQKAVLELGMENGKSINLGTETGKGQIAKIAEEIAQYLSVPLQLQVGSQLVDKYSREAFQIKPFLCSRCGGQLPKINESTTQVICKYCETSFSVNWETNAVSVQSDSL